MKLLFSLTVVLGLSRNSLRITQQCRIPPSRLLVRRRLDWQLFALFAASSLLWKTPHMPWNQRRLRLLTKRQALPPNPVQNLPTAAAPRIGCKSMRIRSDFHDTLRPRMPRERISIIQIRNRNRGPKVRCGSRRPRSSAGGNLCITRNSGDSFR